MYCNKFIYLLTIYAYICVTIVFNGSNTSYKHVPLFNFCDYSYYRQLLKFLSFYFRSEIRLCFRISIFLLSRQHTLACSNAIHRYFEISKHETDCQPNILAVRFILAQDIQKILGVGPV